MGAYSVVTSRGSDSYFLLRSVEIPMLRMNFVFSLFSKFLCDQTVLIIVASFASFAPTKLGMEHNDL